MVRIGQEKTEAVEVEFILARKLIAISTNVFFPTTILNIISFSTNYYKNDYFESIVGINLTSMLVLTALIVQVLLAPQGDLSAILNPIFSLNFSVMPVTHDH